MSLLKNGSQEVRLVWRLMLVIFLYVSASVLLRFIPISIYTTYLAQGGLSHARALEYATAVIFEHPVASTGIGILNGLSGFLIVLLLVKVIEKTKFTWEMVGLNWRRSSVYMVLVGAVFAGLLYACYVLVQDLMGNSSPALKYLLANVSALAFIQQFLLYLAMGFGEEMIFRGYLQTRLVNRFGVVTGILMTSVVFTLLHQISYRLSPVLVVSGVLLWSTLGMLFYLSKSLYLVSLFHGMMNTLLNTVQFQMDDTSGMIAHGAVFLLVLVVLIIRRRLLLMSLNLLSLGRQPFLGWR